MGFRLRYLAHDIELAVGEFAIGRSTECQLSLDDPLVSRRHAVIKIKRDAVSVQDLGSRNGVLVNGVKIDAERAVVAGDKITIGSQEMRLLSEDESDPTLANAGDDVYRRATQTLGAAYVVDLRKAVDGSVTAHVSSPSAPAPASSPSAPAPGSSRSVTWPLSGLNVSAPMSRPSVSAPGSSRSMTPHNFERFTDPPTSEPPSRSQQSFQLLGGVADKALAMGRSEEAERILQALLLDVISRARDGHPVEALMAESAAKYAARLGGATTRGSWVDYVFELYKRLRKPIPAAVVDELYTVVRKAKNIDLRMLRAYLADLRAAAPSQGPAVQFVVNRIEGLERLVSLK
jgi:predicted component of type VI protein secretion system